MPAAFGLLAETCTLPPHRIAPLHEFRVGPWYPFRDFESKISDPKTTAAVGAMICMLGEGQLRDFNFRSDVLKPYSTARFFGKLDTDNRLHDENVFCRGLDLDNPDYELPDTPFEFRGPMPARHPAVPGRLVAGLPALWPGLCRAGVRGTAECAARRSGSSCAGARGRNRRRWSMRSRSGGSRTREGRAVPANQLRLRLQTIDNAAGYWLDTGVLLKS